MTGCATESASDRGADDVTQTPVRGAFTELFNDCLRDECLNDHLIASLAAARRIIEAWRTGYDTVRPHSSLSGTTPAKFTRRDPPRA